METSIASRVYLRLRAHLSEPSAIPGLLSCLLIARCQAVIHEKMARHDCHSLLTSDPTSSTTAAEGAGTSHLRLEVPARAKTRAGISAAVKSIFQNDGVRIRAFTSSDAVKCGTQNRAQQVHPTSTRLIAPEAFCIQKLLHQCTRNIHCCRQITSCCFRFK